MQDNQPRTSLRTSERKAKRKLYSDYVSTADWVPSSFGKRKTNDSNSHTAASTKISKVEIDENAASNTLNCGTHDANLNGGKKKSLPMGESQLTANDDVKNLPQPVCRKKKEKPQKVKSNVIIKNKPCKHPKSSKLAKTPLGSTEVLKEKPRSSHTRQRKAKNFEMVEIDSCEKHVCKKNSCGKTDLICCIKATNNCMEASGKSSRWYHMSMEEHYCNGCFDQYYRVKNSGNDDFHEWKRAWMQNSKADGNFKNLTTYIAERQLPYWVQCTLCGNWRSLTNNVELTPKIIKQYTCIMGNLANTTEEDNENRRAPHIKYSCSEPADPGAVVASDPDTPWMSMLSYIPFLKNSPAAPFLTGYYPDGVGMSAVDTGDVRKLSEFACDVEDDDVIRLPEMMDKLKLKRETTAPPVSNNKGKKGSSCDHSSMMTSPGGRKHSYKEPPVPIEGLNSYFQPFYKPHERGKALCMRPDVMELDEAEEFPMYYKDQMVYLALRNLIIALWFLNPRQFLTVEKCCQHLILRGLTRVRLCTVDIPQILHFATRKGLVNSGALGRKICSRVYPNDKPLPGTLPEEYSKQKVIVIGTGPAGLGAARQLHNFGCDVTCLEARDRIGGRVHDDWSLDGVCVGRGAQIVNGCVNNPLALISHQLGVKMHALRPRCDLFDGTNDLSAKRRPSTKAVSAHCDKRMDFHFNALLDIIVEWRQAQVMDAVDCSLGEKIREAHQEWIKQSGLSFNKLEERLLDFHIGNLEFACGASLDLVSAFHWDQNEIFAQFSGDHTFVQYGFSTPLTALAHGLNIIFNSPVADITYDDDHVEVKTKDGTTHTADRVLVAVPLAVLRSGSIQFHPPLPLSKQDAMDKLGCGCIEKIGLQFSHRFWDKKIDGANYFGYVPSSPDKQGFFSVFYDVPYPQGEKSNVLMSVISGEAVESSRTMSDKDVVDIALAILRDIFPDQDVPEPTKYFLTRWKDDEYAQMAYSYVKCGGSGDDYDEMAKEIDDKVFFAGEGTNRHFPQTVTGAYLSGLREASKIVSYNKLKFTEDQQLQC